MNLGVDPVTARGSAANPLDEAHPVGGERLAGSCPRGPPADGAELARTARIAVVRYVGISVMCVIAPAITPSAMASEPFCMARAVSPAAQTPGTVVAIRPSTLMY